MYCGIVECNSLSINHVAVGDRTRKDTAPERRTRRHICPEQIISSVEPLAQLAVRMVVNTPELASIWGSLCRFGCRIAAVSLKLLVGRDGPCADMSVVGVLLRTVLKSSEFATL